MIPRSILALIALLFILILTLINGANSVDGNFSKIKIIIDPIGNFFDYGFNFIFSLLKFILVLFIVIWIFKPEKVTLIYPFDTLDETYSGEAVSNLLISEIQIIKNTEREISAGSNSLLMGFSLKNIPSEIQIDKRSNRLMNSIKYRKSQEQAGLENLKLSLSGDYLGSNLSEVRATYGGTSLSVGHILFLLRRLCPFNMINTIKGSVQKYGSTVSVIISLIDGKGNLTIWEEKSIIGEDDSPEEHIPGLIRSLSFKVAKELAAKGRHSSHPSMTLGLAYLGLNELKEAELFFNEIREIDRQKAPSVLV